MPRKTPKVYMGSQREQSTRVKIRNMTKTGIKRVGRYKVMSPGEGPYKRTKQLITLLDPEEHEYVSRYAHQNGLAVAVWVRMKLLSSGWRKDLDELRGLQQHRPLTEMDYRHTDRQKYWRKKHEPTMPDPRPQAPDNRRTEDQSGLPEGRHTPDH